MVRSVDMVYGNEDTGYPEPTDQGDVIDHPDHNLPHPMQPRVPQGIQMAGDVVPMPMGFLQGPAARIGQMQNDITREKGRPVDKTNVVPIKKQ